MVALIVVTCGMALLMHHFDQSMLMKLDSMSASDFIQHERSTYNHSIVNRFIFMLLFGGFYLGVVDFLTYLIALFFKRREE